MKKTLLLLSFILLINTSCEKDDFCLQNPVTRNLGLRFYDDTNRETLKSASKLYVWAEGKDSLFVNVTTDSLNIPLNSLKTETVYNFSKDNVVNKFTIKYTPEEQFVSRSCGFKVIFNDITLSSDNTWIKDFTPSTLTTIDNQNAAHVQIFH